ncbi:MAG: sigma-70 family RNA polymerase sigma factor, partial [Anaerolineales bacterium]
DVLGQYLQDIPGYPLLTFEQEQALGAMAEAGLAAQEKLNNNGLTPKQRVEAEAVAGHGREAAEAMVMANVRLVISVAKRYQGRGVELKDLIQCGNIGLLRAVRGYDAGRGYRFSTYATWWIRQAIERSVADQARTIRVPVAAGARLRAIWKAQHELRQELEREPTEEEVAQVLDMPVRKVRMLLRAGVEPASLDKPLGEDEGRAPLGDFVELEAPTPEEILDRRDMRRDCQAALGILPPEERELLQEYFGLAGEEGEVLEELGKRHGFTRERARQIVNGAVTTLRCSPNALRLLAPYVNGGR